jgi:TPR repeat protein
MASMEARLEALRLHSNAPDGAAALLGEEARQSSDPLVVLAYAKQLLAAPRQDADGLRLLKMLATKGLGRVVKRPLSDAQYLLGGAYADGLYGLRASPKRAYHYYLQAAKHMHGEATFQVGQCHEKGAGCKRAPRRAVEYYRKAAVLGEPRAMHRLALVLLFGELGQRRSLKEGISWLKRAAAEPGCWAALHDLARCYEECPVLIRDEAFARECYRKAAAEGGYAPAQFRLGRAHEFGQLGWAPSLGQAVEWYSRAARGGHGQAQMAMSYWTLKGIPGVLEADPSAALAWARRAAAGEDRPVDPAALHQLARFYEEGVGAEGGPDPEEAMSLYGQAAALGHAKSKGKLQALRKQQQQQQQQQKKKEKEKTRSHAHCMIQ